MSPPPPGPRDRARYDAPARTSERGPDPDELDPTQPGQADGSGPDPYAAQRARRADPAEITRLATMLGNRVDKRWRHLRGWARRERTDAVRIYDQDIPELPLRIETYAGHLVVADLRRFRDDDEDDGGGFDAMLGAAGRAVGVGPDRVFARRRRRLRERQAGDQYDKLDERGVWVEVSEAPARLWVNLSDYLDTGLFLDHRPTRRQVAAEAHGRHLLNLYAYTAAFSVHAGLAGAASTTSVDLSATYGDWAERNLRHNQLAPATHQVVRADVREYVTDARTVGLRWDLIVVDPPTFSNSARMDYTWDVQRDHAALLADLAELVSPDGAIWFSTNRRGFALDPRVHDRFDVADRTAATLPEDVRDPQAHRAYRLTPRPAPGRR